MNNTLSKKQILGVNITSASKNKILEYISSSLGDSKEKYYIVTPNPEMVVAAHNNPKFKSILNNAHIALCDGVGLLLASQLLGKPIPERITGTDFVKDLCETFKDQPISIGFLGGKPQIAELAVERLLQEWPHLNIVFVHDEWNDDGFSFSERNLNSGIKSQGKDQKSISKHISTRHIDILFVAFGFPKQEEWIYSNLESLDVSIMIGVGGAFDYLSGTVIRAPFIIRAIGLEWLFRLVRQPWRIKRQLAIIEFLFLVLQQKFS
jgi:N-acetylglucosaminyldiphosphoundecaprenol N-acetyl-beta-D-mannosaminyltransferase